MEYLLVALGIMLIWTTAQKYVVAPEWFQVLVAAVLGIGGAALLDAGRWWLGIGVAGMAFLLLQISDLLLVTGDRNLPKVPRGR